MVSAGTERRSGLCIGPYQAWPRGVPVQEHEGVRSVAREGECRGAGSVAPISWRDVHRRAVAGTEGSRGRPRCLRARARDRSARPERRRRAGGRRAPLRTSRSRPDPGAKLYRHVEFRRGLVGLQERHARSRRPAMVAEAGPQVSRLPLAVMIAVSVAVIRAGQQPIFRTGVDVVRVDVSVMNGLTPVAGLKAENFVVTDNGVPQTMDSVSLDTVPLNLML